MKSSKKVNFFEKKISSCVFSKKSFWGTGKSSILLFQQLKNANKLGKPKPDVTFSGVRGVIWDNCERAWVCRWGESGLQRYQVFHVNEESNFAASYQKLP